MVESGPPVCTKEYSTVSLLAYRWLLRYLHLQIDPHPFDILGIVPSVSCIKDELLKAKSVANFTLARNGGPYYHRCDVVEYEYTAE